MFMEALDAILSRRSIRKYTRTPVPDQIIKELLTAGMSAPSARNTQSWQFIIINSHKILDEIPKFHPYSEMLKDASVAFLVCGDKQLEENEGYLVQNCSAVTENILIAAQAKGLGAVWLGIYPRNERIMGIRKLLDIPNDFLPISLISIGYPAEDKSREYRYDVSKIHYNGW
jgi:nitroreductase